MLIDLSFKGLLFDLDGTLIHSLAAVERAWRKWAVEFGLDPDYVAPRIHGRRAVDSIAALAPHLDQQEAFARLEHLEATDTQGVVPLPGVVAFLKSLKDIPWAIVTSGSLAIAEPRIAAAGIPQPFHLVTANDVTEGKPSPMPFLVGAYRLGLGGSEILAFEDTLAGVRSAKSAGMKVVGLSQEAASEANHFFENFEGIQIVHQGDDWFKLQSN